MVCEMSYSTCGQENVFYHQIMCLSCMGFMSGYTDGTFRPSLNVSRGQLSKIVSNRRASGMRWRACRPSRTYCRVTLRVRREGWPRGVSSEGTRVEARASRAVKVTGPTSGWGCRSRAAGLQDRVWNAWPDRPMRGQFYADVDESNPFYHEIMRLSNRGVMSGYQCGGVNPQTGQT